VKRSVSVVLVLLVVAVAWLLARPSGGDDLKTPEPMAAFQRATEQGKPVFVMITADT